MANAKFVIYADKAGKYRWRLVSANGKETASSAQHFASHYDAKRAAEMARRALSPSGVLMGVVSPDGPLHGGSRSGAFRQGAIVYRSAGPWTPAVQGLLRHLEAVGFDGAPRVVGDGTKDGREVLTFIEGEIVHPLAWNDDGVAAVGRLLRQLHAAAATFRAPPGAIWQPWFVRDEGSSSIIGHGEPAPWNIVARDLLPVAFVDWEFAGPVDRLDEVAHAAWLNCQLHDDDIAVMHELPSVEERARQLRAFVDGYGLDASERIGFVERMIHFAVRACAHEAIDAHVTPNSTDPAPLWALAWRARSAAWMIRHESILHAALFVAPE